MTRKVHAIFENGLLRLLEPLEGLAEHARVHLTVDIPDRSVHALADCFGILPDEDAAEMLAIIRGEFEQVNPGGWQ